MKYFFVIAVTTIFLAGLVSWVTGVVDREMFFGEPKRRSSKLNSTPQTKEAEINKSKSNQTLTKEQIEARTQKVLKEAQGAKKIPTH